METKRICVKLSWQFFLLSLLLFFTVMPAFAQWTTQTIHLKPGWNAVFLEVQPQPNDCDTLFFDIPVESVWMWNQRFSTVQYIQDPNEIVPKPPEWLTYMPPSLPGSLATNLFTLLGGRAYLIKLSGANPVDWQVVGKPVVRDIDWISDSFNLVGFGVNENLPPTFEEFFASSSAHAGQKIYRLNGAGQWEPVELASFRLHRGEAYWVYCQGTSAYAGPLKVNFEQGKGIDFGRTLMEQTLRLRNESDTPRTVTLSPLLSDEPPDFTLPALAGPVPLSYWRSEADITASGWRQFPAELSVPIGPNAEVALRLEVRRRDMVKFTPPVGRTGLYQSLLEVSDGNGSKFLLPVTSKGRQPALAGYAGRARVAFARNQDGTVDPNAGLWVGTVTVNKVSQPSNDSDSDTPVATASEFQFRILIHVDSGGQARLLQQVILAVIDKTGNLVLLTDDSEDEGSVRSALPLHTLRGRISSAAFALDGPFDQEKGFGKYLFITLTLGYNHPLNPFKHKYHPGHDNKDERFEDLDKDVESFEVTRVITLTFDTKAPEGIGLAGFGDSYVTGGYNDNEGYYSEEITRIHKQPIHVYGKFLLHRVSLAPVLDQEWVPR